MKLWYNANHRGEAWWVGTFERKRFTQHAILRRAYKHSATRGNALSMCYVDDGRTVLFICEGDATIIGYLADDLRDESIVDFHLTGSQAEFNEPEIKSVLNKLAGWSVRVDNPLGPIDCPEDPEDPFAYDERTLPALAEDLVRTPRTVYGY